MKGKAGCLLLSLLFVCLAQGALASSAELEREIQGAFHEARVIAKAGVVKLNGGSRISDELSRLEGLSEGLQINHLLLQERFQARRAILQGSPLERQQEMEARYLRAIADFTSLINHLPPAASLQAEDLQPLLKLLDELLPSRPRPLLGTLPYQNLNYPARQPLYAPTILPAYKGGDGSVTAADTQGSPEGSITPEIAALAESLGWSPVRIYEWVQANIESEWYWGSMKGAAETLRQRSGNDADQSALLISLLRASGFPARYVRGVVEFFPGLEQAKNLTGLEEPLKIAAFFQKAGIPFEPVVAGGRIANFRIEHIWVETEVPYSNYRGAVLDNHGKVWIALDTHLKPAGYAWNQPQELAETFPLADIRNSYLAAPQSATPLEYLRAELQEDLAARFSDFSYTDHLRRRTRPDFSLELLPASLQFHQVAITGEYSALPADLIHRVVFKAAAPDGSELFTYTTDAADLSNRKVSLFYEPETVQDQQLIDSYGGLDNTPSYLVRLRPVLMVDGERRIVAREGLPMGADYTLSVVLVSPNGAEETVGQHVAGNLAALGIVAQRALPPAELPLAEKDAEHLLHEEALRYIERWSAAEDELASLLQVAPIRPLPTVVTVGGVIEVAYLLDTPHGFAWKGLFIDAGLRRIEVVAEAGREEREREFMRLAALQGSVLENRLFEEDFGVESVSTAKLLGVAAQEAVSIRALDGSNLDAVLPTLDLAENVQEDIRNAVHQGYVVKVPEAEIAYRRWTGIGYLKEHPETGEAGYMLSGMIAGGMTADEWANQELRSRFFYSFSEPPNRDPQAAARIVKIPAGDKTVGIVGQVVEEPLAVLVVDLAGQPVVGATVTFTVLDGGGRFEGTGSIEAVTGENGVAKAWPRLGTSTEKNSAFLMADQGDTYPTQVGTNLFTASVQSQYGALPLSQPFTLYGRPDNPVKIVKKLGDETWYLPNNPAGTVSVDVVDQYDNPISNIPVTFSAREPVSMDPGKPLPAGARNIEFYDTADCPIAYPLYGDCGSAPIMTEMSHYFGASMQVVLGNTLYTKYTVEVSAPDIPSESFTLYTNGQYLSKAYYLPPQLLISALDLVNEKGELVDAAKAGDPLKTPLSATMFLTYIDYAMEGPYACTKRDSSGEAYQTECWDIKGDGIVRTRRITDGTVNFTAIAGDGAAGPTETLGDGAYWTTYTTGKVPALNVIEAIGEVTLTFPEVLCRPDGNAITEGYETGALPTRTLTLKSGTSVVFDPATRELYPPNLRPITYGVYGVDVPTAVTPEIVFLGEGDLSRENITVLYTVEPTGAGLAGYNALSTQLDLLSVDAYGDEDWEGYLIGDAITGAGKAVVSYGTVFDPKKRHFVQAVLNRGSDIEIRGEKTPMRIVQIDLDIDSDNNAGYQADGAHNDPASDLLEDQAEDYPGASGKVLRPNFLDIDGDKVPGFADGIDLYGNAGENASAPFVPMLLKIAGDIDPAKVRVRFRYSASDPAQVSRQGDQTTGFTYLPAPGTETDPGALRLWTKDGRQSRKVASIKEGGDYIKPNEAYTLGDLGTKTEKGFWRFFVEGVKSNLGTAHNQIKVEIDLEGNAAYQEADAVRATAIAAFLVPDYNHNREIDEEDIHRAEKGDTYYFWINDDDDAAETEGEDIPGQARIFNQLDWEHGGVDGVRDLIDFFPVHLDIGPLLQVFDPRIYSFVLKSPEESLNLVLTELVRENVGNYLIDVPTARTLGDALTFKVTAAGLPLNPGVNCGLFGWCGTDITGLKQKFKEFLLGIPNQSRGIILLEGAKKGNKPLSLEIIDSAGKLVFAGSLNLSLDGVEKMFRHKNLINTLRASYPGGRIDSNHDVVPEAGMPDRLRPEDFGEGREQFEGFDAETDENSFVHVHGFNVNGETARGEQAEAFKRLYWSGARAKFYGITWYGWESQDPLLFKFIPCTGTRSPNYHVNVRHALNTGRLLKEFVNGNVAGNITAYGHSLGNMVVSSAISGGMNVQRYLMVNPAVAEEAYTPEAAYADGGPWDSATKKSMYHPAWRFPDGKDEGYQPFLWASEWYKRFRGSAGDDRAFLTWRDLFSGVRNNTKAYVYYAPTDEAFRPFNLKLNMVDGPSYPDNRTDWPGLEDLLQNVSCFDGSKIGTYSWSLQELLKGRFWADRDNNDGGWKFNMASDDGYYVCTEPPLPEEQPVCEMIPPAKANALAPAVFRVRPFFARNTDHPGLYSDQAVSVGTALQEEILANEMPALTFAVGHRGVAEIRTADKDRDIDIRQKFLKGISGAPWPRGTDEYDWRHSDVYVVAYPFLYRLYDDLALKIKGE